MTTGSAIRVPPGLDQVSGGRRGVVHFESNPDFGTGLAVGFNLVDQPHLRGVGNLEGSPAGFRNGDTGVAISSKAACSGNPSASRKNDNAAS